MRKPPTEPAGRDVGRRAFLRAVPAGLAAGAAPGLVAGQPRPVRPRSETLASAATLADLDFTAAERELMRAAVARNRHRYRQLRGLAIGPEVEPAIHFDPTLVAGRPAGRATPHAPQPFTRASGRDAPAALESLAFAPLTVLATLLEARRVSATELTGMYLDRLARYGPRLRCVVTLTPELARAQAAQADREMAAGRYRGPLHGVPWGAKDLLATAGIHTTWGARPFADQVPDHDAAVVERLRAAGAVLVAKLSMGALARGGVWFGGSTRNPWDLRQSSSGSSAGSGAATAAGLVGFALGSETLGSIISPSAACGVTGLRPTYGRVSRHGAMALSWTMDKIGPMCRRAEDCALVLNAIYGPDGRDGTTVDAPFRWRPAPGLEGLRIGYVERELDDPPGDATGAHRAALRAALDVLRAAGAEVVPVTLPDFPADALRIILEAESAAAFDDLTRDGGVDELTRQTADAWPNTFRASRFIPAVEYLRAQRARTLLLRRLEELLAEVDAFVSPPRSAGLTMTNLTGHPAVTVRAGMAGGLPLALMVTGRLWDEETVLRVAHAYEQRTPWAALQPNLGPAEV